MCCWRHRVREAHRWHHARTGHDERVHAQAVRTARDAGLVLGAFATLDFPLTDVQVFDVKGSPPRRGGPYGNDVAEPTDRLLKKELVCRNSYATVGQLRRGPDDCVWWSDDRRLHSTLGYRNPKEFTEQGLVL